MSYTNINLVRNHFALNVFESADTGQCELKLTGADWISLPGRSIKNGSLFVGAIRKNEPSSEKVTLGSSPVSLSNSHIVADSVTVASDESLGAIYTETVDYTLNCDTGEIARIPDGSIPAGSELTVWFFHYEPYTEGEDYSADYQWGRIKRLAGGNIADGQVVMIGYEQSGANIEDSLLESAVAEANAIVQSKIDPEGRFGADTVLQTAATYLAVSIACRSTAVICMGTGVNQKQVSSDWLRLSDSFRNDFESLLRTFRPEVTKLKPPVRT